MLLIKGTKFYLKEETFYMGTTCPAAARDLHAGQYKFMRLVSLGKNPAGLF